jgi:hypothetical protein
MVTTFGLLGRIGTLFVWNIQTPPSSTGGWMAAQVMSASTFTISPLKLKTGEESLEETDV